VIEIDNDFISCLLWLVQMLVAINLNVIEIDNDFISCLLWLFQMLVAINLSDRNR